MILKNLFLKKKIKMNTMKKKITRKKKYPPNKKHFIFFFTKIPEYMEYFVYVTDWYSIVIHMLHCTQQRERVRD